MDFSDLAKLSTKVLPTATTLSSRHSLLTSSAECGSYNDYNPQYDLISVMKDPFLSQVSDKNVATVYTTDVALAHLMVAIRSQLSWFAPFCSLTSRDLEIIKNAHGIFISHRDGVFDTYTVNETSADLPTEEENKDNCLR